MSCKLPPEVAAYLEAVEADKPRACPEQHALAAHIRRCFETEDLRVDTEQLRRYLSLSRYFPYKELFLWERFLTALWMCTYTADGRPRRIPSRPLGLLVRPLTTPRFFRP